MATTNSYDALLAAFNALAAKVDLLNEKVDRLTALAVENASSAVFISSTFLTHVL
jgi:hypothetical protein